MTHTAILLAAGRARRLKELTESRPKCLLTVGDATLIEHQIAALRDVGVRDIVVVTGYYADQVMSVCGRDVTYVHNEVYATTNSLYSLALALERGEGGFVLTNADVLFAPELLHRLVSSDHADALLLEPNTNLGDEEMKVRLDGDRVVAMSKQLRPGTFDGENLGVLRFSGEGHARLTPIVERLVAEEQTNAWAPLAFDHLCREYPLHAVTTGGLPWIEIDFAEDLQRARTEIWPRLKRRGGVRGGSAHEAQA